MPFSTYEQSDYQGTPAALVDLRYGDAVGDIVRITNAGYDLTVGGEVYTSVPMERDGFSEERSPDDGQQLTLKMPRSNPFADVYLTTEFEKTVTVKIKAVDLLDPALATAGVWSGRLTGVSWEHPHMLVGCEHMATAMRRYALRGRYQRQCRHAHFFGQCRLNKDDWAAAGTINTVTGGDLLDIPEAAAYADGYFTGGMVRVGGVYRYVLQHLGSSIWISRSALLLTATTAVTLYPGCDRLASTCSLKYNNIENYGGFDYSSSKGPFEGISIV